MRRAALQGQRGENTTGARPGTANTQRSSDSSQESLSASAPGDCSAASRHARELHASGADPPSRERPIWQAAPPGVHPPSPSVRGRAPAPAVPQLQLCLRLPPASPRGEQQLANPPGVAATGSLGRSKQRWSLALPQFRCRRPWPRAILGACHSGAAAFGIQQ